MTKRNDSKGNTTGNPKLDVAFSNTAEACALLERRVPEYLRRSEPSEPAGKAFWRVAVLLSGHERRGAQIRGSK